MGIDITLYRYNPYPNGYPNEEIPDEEEGIWVPHTVVRNGYVCRHQWMEGTIRELKDLIRQLCYEADDPNKECDWDCVAGWAGVLLFALQEGADDTWWVSTS